MITYLITTHAHPPASGCPGRGSWGNIRHPDDASAAEAARIDAKGKPHDIRRETPRGRKNNRQR